MGRTHRGLLRTHSLVEHAGRENDGGPASHPTGWNNYCGVPGAPSPMNNKIIRAPGALNAPSFHHIHIGIARLNEHRGIICHMQGKPGRLEKTANL
ncbi:hypothetical protein NSK11_contig00053-0008 [Nocardia seriolae]|uniref:Uncharacterized protein n=1 Tax=Nocardia seriolae TaxID=37332 RepID=A0ABC9YVE6_9NOCA|nr:hypothetical protein NS07_v2contig00049-0042 [Nocardia seriolae]GAP29290.1 hypothetical protein NSK11_contig00053-0008 [Nocardia seriolae]